MNDDYAKASGSPRTFRIGDKDYRVGKLTPRDYGDLQAYVKSQIPDPRLKARELCEGMPDAIALAIWKDLSEEAKDWPPAIWSGRGNELLMFTWEGAAQVLYVALRRHNDVRREDASVMAMNISQETLQDLVQAVLPEPTFDPKSTATTEA